MFCSSAFPDNSPSVPRECGAWRAAPCAWPCRHTLLHPLLKCCVLLLSSTTWSKDRCDLAVQTLAPEPESPKSVIQVNSSVEMQSELPVAILPWAMNAPSDSSEGFFKKPEHYWFFLSQKVFLFPVLCCGPCNRFVYKPTCEDTYFMKETQVSNLFSHWSHLYWNTFELATNLLQNRQVIYFFNKWSIYKDFHRTFFLIFYHILLSK